MPLIKIDTEHISNFISEEELHNIAPAVKSAQETIEKGNGAGCDYLGWLNIPSNKSMPLVEKIEETASYINSNAEAFICIGIGGSYLGTRAGTEFSNNTFHNQSSNRKGAEIYYAGHNLGSDYMADLLDIIKNKDVCLNIISKSGTTLEPASAFRILRGFLEDKYGREEARKRIIATTDSKKGTLKALADSEGYTTFVIPDNVGGRYSVLTPVGLLPIAVSGINIRQMLTGARAYEAITTEQGLDANPANLYAAIRNILYRKGKTIEIMASFNPSLHYIAEWWKQLTGESEGKNKQGIYPASVDLTSDLHSMGQWIQEGNRIIFETFLNIEQSNREINVPEEDGNNDGLNYLAGKNLDYINDKAYRGTASAHAEGGVPNITINLKNRSPETLGGLFYFFEKAIAVSGYMQWINPFNQPGVEFYKSNMFKLLGRP